MTLSKKPSDAGTFPREREIGPFHMLLLFPGANETKRYVEVAPNLDVVVTTSTSTMTRFLVMQGAEREALIDLLLPGASLAASILRGNETETELVEASWWDRLLLGLPRKWTKRVLGEEAYILRLPDGTFVLQGRGRLLPLVSNVRLSNAEAIALANIFTSAW